MEIKAALIGEEGANPTIQNYSIEEDSEKLTLKVKASALNHRDLWIVKGQYGRIQYPIILGSVGVVD